MRKDILELDKRLRMLMRMSEKDLCEMESARFVNKLHELNDCRAGK